MPINIILIGGLRDGTTHSNLLGRLQAVQCDEAVTWEWLATCAPNWQPSKKEMDCLLDRLRKWKSATKKGDTGQPHLNVVKLVDLHGRAARDLFDTWKDPKLVPTGITTADELVRWLLSPDAGLIPRREWYSGQIGCALIAILSKLLKTKRWAGSVAGHDFLKESDLLHQAPVDRPGYSNVAGEAAKMLGSFAGGLLWFKGGSKTPREWAINTQFLPAIKQAFVEKSFAPFRAIPGLEGLIDQIENEAGTIDLLNGVVNEKVLHHCQSRST